MEIQRFHDETIDQFSYLIADGGEAVVIDPCRRIAPYLEYLDEHRLKLVAIALTHRPGAFASGWAELRQRSGALLVAAGKYHFHGEGEFREAGRATMVEFGDGCHLQTQLTPGFTADSISLLAMNKAGETEGIFTGNTLLQDGAGYPLPRPEDKNPLHNERTYAKETYESIHGIVKGFPPRATVYAGFGEDAHFSKMGEATHGRFNLTEAQDESPVFDKKIKNADQFADWLTEDYPFVPAYVLGCLKNNTEGYPSWADCIEPFRHLLGPEIMEELAATDSVASPTSIAPAAPHNVLPLGKEAWIVDTRDAADFKAGHALNAINIQANGEFALWLGAILRPGDDFHVLVDTPEAGRKVAQSIGKIGYDAQVRGAVKWSTGLDTQREPVLDFNAFKDDYIGKYTIVDVRPEKPAMEDTRFYGAINIPVWQLRDRWTELPLDRPLVVHCGGGYQSAIGASLLRRELGTEVVVYDLGDKIKKVKKP